MNQRLRKNPPFWNNTHTNAVKNIKAKVKSLPILYVADDSSPKIVESDASDLGWGGILKQGKDDEEQIIQFSSGTWNPIERNYSIIEREVTVAWNSIGKFEIHLVNKKFLLRSDAFALKKILTKDIKKLVEAKFARWQALFANFDFDVEHIKGSENCLLDFLSREHIQQPEHIMVIVTEWDPNQPKEILRSIPEDKSCQEYCDEWKPTWQLRNTKVLDANAQNHTDILHLVLERKVYPKGSRWIHDMVYSRSMIVAHQAEETLRSDFHDIIMIWFEGGDRRKVYHKYFCINRTRNLA